MVTLPPSLLSTTTSVTRTCPTLPTLTWVQSNPELLASSSGDSDLLPCCKILWLKEDGKRSENQNQEIILKVSCYSEKHVLQLCRLKNALSVYIFGIILSLLFRFEKFVTQLLPFNFTCKTLTITNWWWPEILAFSKTASMFITLELLCFGKSRLRPWGGVLHWCSPSARGILKNPEPSTLFLL